MSLLLAFPHSQTCEHKTSTSKSGTAPLSLSAELKVPVSIALSFTVLNSFFEFVFTVLNKPFRSYQLSHCVERASVYTTLWTERASFRGLICDTFHHLVEKKGPIFKAPSLAVLSLRYRVERPISQDPTETLEGVSHSRHPPVPHLVNTDEETMNNKEILQISNNTTGILKVK